MYKVISIAFLLTSCASVQYWVKPDAGLQKTAADLSACRNDANQGGQKVFTAVQLEHPCMTAKGYQLSPTPPQ